MVTKSEDCNKCRGCCKFEKGDEYFAPLFTKEEVNKLKSVKKKSIKNTPIFKNYKKSNNVFQIGLIKSKKEKDVSVCPFLDEDKHLCLIYSLRPFDCKLWPFVLVKEGNKINLNCFDRDLCPSFDKASNGSFEAHKKEIIKLVKSKIDLIKTHPELAWENEEDTFFVSSLG